MLGGYALQHIISQLEQIVIKLYRLEIHEAITTWNSVFEELALVVEEIKNRDNIIEILKIIATTIENKDYILMADLIRYELLQFVEEVE